MARIASEADKIVRGNAGGQVHNCALMAKSRWANILVDRGGEAALPGKGGYTPLARVRGAGNCVLAPRETVAAPSTPPPPFLNPALMVKKEEEEEVINYSSQRPLFVFFGQESRRLPLFSRVVFFSFVSWRTLLSVPFRFQTFRAGSRASAFSENKSRCSCVPRAEKARHVYVNGVAFGTHERALSSSFLSVLHQRR